MRDNDAALWQRLTDGTPRKGQSVLLATRKNNRWTYIAVPEWTETHDRVNKGYEGRIWWRLICPPVEG